MQRLALKKHESLKKIALALPSSGFLLVFYLRHYIYLINEYRFKSFAFDRKLYLSWESMTSPTFCQTSLSIRKGRKQLGLKTVVTAARDNPFPATAKKLEFFGATTNPPLVKAGFPK